MARFMSLLQAADPELHDHLVITNKVGSAGSNVLARWLLRTWTHTLT